MFTISPRKCHDNPLVHSAAVMVAKMIELGLQLIRHHPYYLGLAPLDYFFEKEREKEKLFNRGLEEECIFCRKEPTLSFGSDQETGGLREESKMNPLQIVFKFLIYLRKIFETSCACYELISHHL